MGPDSQEPLFHNDSLSDVLYQKEAKALEDIDRLNQKVLLETPVDKGNRGKRGVKMTVAHLVTPHIQRADLNGQLDLLEKVQAACRCIRQWNGLPITKGT